MDLDHPSSQAASPTVTATGVLPRSDGSRGAARPQFLPGVVLGRRYRIIELLGRGGMGEVFRADDLKLGHSVALKFLSRDLANDPAAMERLQREVRIARQVSHPNVCRVYDLTETEGWTFLTMEHVDGEDLASIFQRLGRPTKDKALQIARQLCAGLAAAHERGVLHLDLKPSNLMIDGRGQLRIMDFGVAAFMQESRGVAGAGGTPAYMAPEQLAGQRVSARSDLYSLGLVLYELFTGTRAFPAAPQHDGIQAHQNEQPRAPASLVDDLDPAVEQVILRCLEKKPKDRPTSARAVLAALPGGDPLAEILAAGETPSPEMVAAAGGEGGLRPATAGVCLGWVLSGILGIALLNDRVALHRLAGPEKPGVVLADRAREILAGLGYTTPPADRRYGFDVYRDYLNHLERNDSSPDRWLRLGEGRPTPYKFWYRESPTILVPDVATGKVTPVSPSMGVAGMALMILDGGGHLETLSIVPPQLDPSVPGVTNADYSPLFEAAGLDPSRFVRTDPTWNPDFFADDRAAWLGEFASRSNWTVRVEAAAYRGRPIFFHVIEPPDRPWRHAAAPVATNWKQVLNGAENVLMAAALVGILIVARRNVRLGRGDRRGGWRLGVAVFSISLTFAVLWMDHPPDLNTEVNLLIWMTLKSIANGVVAGLGYLALEPYTRRVWPTTLVSWTRLLLGQVRNPRVGRDVLIGVAAGVAMIVAQRMEPVVAAWLGSLPRVPYTPSSFALKGGREALGLIFEPGFVLIPMVFVLFLTGFRFLLRNPWLAMATVLAMAFVMDDHWHWREKADASTLAAVGEMLFVYGILLLVLVRSGLLAGVVAWFVVLRVQAWPLTLDMAAWYAGTSIVMFVVVAGLAFWGWQTALTGRSANRLS